MNSDTQSPARELSPERAQLLAELEAAERHIREQYDPGTVEFLIVSGDDDDYQDALQALDRAREALKVFDEANGLS